MVQNGNGNGTASGEQPTHDGYEMSSLLKQVTKNFNFEGLTQSESQTLRVLGTRLEKAFLDPIEAIR